jgi:cytosine/adenosine deaminase-related metal-dependent hydrolase
MKTILKDCTILCGHDFEAVEGFLVMEDGIITEIGEGNCNYRGAMNLKGTILCPSFTNAHIHLGDAVARDLGAYERIEARVGPGGVKFQVLEQQKDQVPAGIRDALEKMKAGGVRAFCDFREGGVEGLKQVPPIPEGMDAVVLGRPDGDRIEAVLDRCDGIGISSPADYSEDELKDISRTARRMGKLVAVHTSEVADDLEAALVAKPDFLVHGTHLSGESLEVLKRKAIPLVLCARANAMLGVGLPRIKELFDRTAVALGTDNVMVQEPDMFREMDFVFKLARGQEGDPAFEAVEVLRAATTQGRRILGLRDNAIIEGNQASFITIKRGKYIYDPVLAVVHRAGLNDILTSGGF